MLTFQCAKVLQGLKRLSLNTECNISYLCDTTCFCNDDVTRTYDYKKYENEIESIIHHLVDNGYLQFQGNEYNFHLTQKAIHCTATFFQEFFLFLFKSIAVPIIVSIITTLITLHITGEL